MNVNCVISLPSAVAVTDALPQGLIPHRRVMLTSDGVTYAGPDDADVGSSLPGDLNREQAAVQTRSAGLHYLETADATPIVMGDLLEGAEDGKVTLQVDGVAAWVAGEDCSEESGIIRCLAIEKVDAPEADSSAGA